MLILGSKGTLTLKEAMIDRSLNEGLRAISVLIHPTSTLPLSIVLP
jgi:hypothetical protein